MDTPNAPASPRISTVGGRLATGVAAIVALSLLMASAASLQAPLDVDESGFEGAATAERA